MNIRATLTLCGYQVLGTRTYDQLPERDQEVSVRTPCPFVVKNEAGDITEHGSMYSSSEFIDCRVQVYGLTTMHEVIQRIEALENRS